MNRQTSGIFGWDGPSRPGRARASDRRRLRPGLLALEDRRLLATFTVTSIADTLTGGDPTTGTLRWAVEQANSATDASTIDFDPTLFATPKTITLTQGELKLNANGSETITGPAAGVTISGGGKSQVFLVEFGVTAMLSGLTITGGSASTGSVPAAGDGGGVFNQGKTTLDDCTISTNSAAGEGGGLYNAGMGNLTLNNCTISGNSCQSDGGGLYNSNSANSDLTLNGCTIDGNSAGGKGGGLDTSSTGTLTNCTISGNTAGVLGGGLMNDATATLYDCTIGANSSDQYGGGLANYGDLTLADTIVAGNTRPSAPSDIHNSVGTISGAYNLIGDGGSGPLEGGEDGNIVLTSLTISSLGLGLLGSYGGSTQTIPLLPGSAAIAKGTAA